MLSLGATGTLTFRNIHRECTSSTELFRCHDLDKLPVAEPRACLGCSWSKPLHFVTFSLHKSPQEFTVCGWDHILKWSRSDKMGRRGQACSQQRSCYKKPGCPVWLLGPGDGTVFAQMLHGEGSGQLTPPSAWTGLRRWPSCWSLGGSADKMLTQGGKREAFLPLGTFLCHSES